MSIERNRNPTGRIANVVFGLATLGDGLVRVLSFGFLHTCWPLNVAAYQSKQYFAALKAARGRA